ncbi:hypothetical protein BDF14DRAFT_573659 [Spinellus fusiger]|nr:hypothetical protein BDF14DRAFT_573659 [Spinellus fusiger]
MGIRLAYNGLYRRVHTSITTPVSSSSTRRSGYVALVQGSSGSQATHRDVGASSAWIEHDVDSPQQERHSEEIGGLGMTCVGALLWPVLSSLLGRCLAHYKPIRKYLPDPFLRNVASGCLLVVIKDVGNLFYAYERIRQSRSRHVKSFRAIEPLRRKRRG